ncbi:hypothetical protein BSKO_04257 [Bryopsis sp. KO-2023]|nr:hypothetical protein BSKO_04257 [Bryopsis sp. KO-2023]
MWHNVTTLGGGRNYTLTLAIEDKDGVLAPAVTSVVGIVTPDASAPTFTNITLVDATTDAIGGTFNLTLDARLNEESTVHYAVYTNHCATGGIGQVSDALRIYFVAEDTTPNFKDLGNSCQSVNATESIYFESCIAHGTVSCSQDATSKVDLPNQQDTGFLEWDHTAGTATGGDPAELGASVSISLESPSAPTFLLLEFPVGDRGPSYISMRFQIDMQGLVVFSVASMIADIDAILTGAAQGVQITEIGNGRFPVFDPSQVHSVNITACDPNQLVGGEKYIVVVVARDKYGRVQSSVVKELVETPNN